MTDREASDILRHMTLIICVVVFAIIAKYVGIFLGSMIGYGLWPLVVALTIVGVCVAYGFFKEMLLV